MGNNWRQAALALLLLLAGNASASCWTDASERYNVPVPLLRAIAEVESSNRARVVARNTNGSLDMGFMQINDWWLPRLAKYGISADQLLNPCTSLHVGGWILAQNIRQMGYGWEAVGAYGAGTKKDKAAARLKYARKVWKVLDRQVAHGLGKRPELEPVAAAADAMQQPKRVVAVRHQRGILVVELE